MHPSGHTSVVAKSSDFVFGSSPDGIVIDSSNTAYIGFFEVKCPYTRQDMSPEEACEDPNYYCYKADNGMFTLKWSHQQYDQVQFQLYVSADFCDWFDFCI